VKERNGLLSECALRRLTPRQRIQNRVLSIYQPHTKKGFYEDHFVIWYKRLERDKFHWPRNGEQDVVILTGEQLNWLLDGYDVWRMKPHEALRFSVFS
jgi:IS66 Orf2 like protein